LESITLTTLFFFSQVGSREKFNVTHESELVWRRNLETHVQQAEGVRNSETNYRERRDEHRAALDEYEMERNNPGNGQGQSG
jgi:hypothetical protein